MPVPESESRVGDIRSGRHLLEAAETINSSLESASLDTIILAEATRLVRVRRSALLVTKGDALVAQETFGLSDRCRELLRGTS